MRYNNFQPRFANGIYRDCKWCGGRGCLSCGAEAEKEYNRQFPNGPQPVATISTEGLGEGGIAELLQRLVSNADKSAIQKADEAIKSNPSIPSIVGASEEECKEALRGSLFQQSLIEEFSKAGEKR